MNQLPKNFAVYNDGSQLFDNYVLNNLNIKHKRGLISESGVFYGENNGKIFSCYEHNLPREVEILTTSQFIELSKEKQVVYGVCKGSNYENIIESPLFHNIEKAKESLLKEIESIKSGLNFFPADVDFIKEDSDISVFFYRYEDMYIYIKEFELI